jgi:hypothetical protein
MEPKCVFWFGKLSTEWWERHPQAIMCKYGEKKLMNNTYPASGANAKGSNDIPRDNIRLECRMQKARYIHGTNKTGSDLEL